MKIAKFSAKKAFKAATTSSRIEGFKVVKDKDKRAKARAIALKK